MPGLIDCHDHEAHTGFDLMERASAPLSLTMMRIANNMKITLEAGITTLRDMGGLDIGFKMAVEQGLIPGPRLLVALTILSRTGGIDDPRLRSGVDLSWRQLPGLPSPVVDGVEECRKRVREVLHAGADVIKCASTGGVSSQTLTATVPTLTLEELTVIVEEAHMVGKRTTVHAYGGPGLENAVRAGIDSVEHGSYPLPAARDDRTDGRPGHLFRAHLYGACAPSRTRLAVCETEGHRADRRSPPLARDGDEGRNSGGDGNRCRRLWLWAQRPGAAPVDRGRDELRCRRSSPPPKPRPNVSAWSPRLERWNRASTGTCWWSTAIPSRTSASWNNPNRIEMVIKGGEIYVDRRAQVAA